MALMLLIEREQRRALRRERVFRDRGNPFDEDNDKKLVEHFRFDRRSICYLADLLAPELNKTRRSKGLLPVHQVLVALRYYATGTFQLVCGKDGFAVKSTANRAFWSVTKGLIRMRNRFIAFPRGAAASDRIKYGFYQLANFPSVVGVIDGTHVRIQNKNEPALINRKGTPSINVQCTCGPDGQFTSVYAKWGGRTHDAFVWSQSDLCRGFENGRYDDGVLLGELLVTTGQ